MRAASEKINIVFETSPTVAFNYTISDYLKLKTVSSIRFMKSNQNHINPTLSHGKKFTIDNRHPGLFEFIDISQNATIEIDSINIVNLRFFVSNKRLPQISIVIKNSKLQTTESYRYESFIEIISNKIRKNATKNFPLISLI